MIQFNHHIISLYRTTFSPGWKDQHQQWTNSWGRLEVNVLGTIMLVKTNKGNCHSRYRRPTKGSFETQMCKYFTLIFQGVRYTAVEGMVRKRQNLATLQVKDFHPQLLQVNQDQIAEILARYFGTGQRWHSLLRLFKEIRFATLPPLSCSDMNWTI